MKSDASTNLDSTALSYVSSEAFGLIVLYVSREKKRTAGQVLSDKTSKIIGSGAHLIDPIQAFLDP